MCVLNTSFNFAWALLGESGHGRQRSRSHILQGGNGWQPCRCSPGKEKNYKEVLPKNYLREHATTSSVQVGLGGHLGQRCSCRGGFHKNQSRERWSSSGKQKNKCREFLKELNLIENYGLLTLLALNKCDSLWPHGLQLARFLCPWNFPGRNSGVGCHSLFQGIFPT